MENYPAFGSGLNRADLSNRRTLLRDLEAGRPSICHNYLLNFYTCEGTIDQVFVVDLEWLPIDYIKDITQETAKTGELIVSNYTVRKKFAFEFLTDDATADYLEKAIAIYPTIKLQGAGSPVLYDLFGCETELLDSDSGLLHKKISFYCKQYPPETTALCCASSWSEDDELEIRDPSSTDLCEGKTANLSSTDSTLTLNATGGVANSTWTKEGVLIGYNLSSTTITGLFGMYYVAVDIEGCLFNLQYNHLDPCASFVVVLETEGSIIRVPNPPSGAAYEWEYSADGTTFEAYPGNTSSVVADEAGFYRVTAASSECEASAIVQYYGENACDYDIVITEEANHNLSAVINPFNIAYEYQWYIDTGEGAQLIDGAVAPEYQAQATGLYELKVTLDDCIVFGRKVVIFPAESGLCCNIIGIINVVDEALVVSFDGCNEDAYITWFVNTGLGFIQIGAGTSVVPTVDGLYRAHIRCGECETDVDYLHYNCEEDPCTDFSLTLINVGDTFTVQIEGCDDVTSIEWSVENETGKQQLFVYGPTITPTIPGLYKARVTCGDSECVQEIAFIAYDCDGCLEINFGEPEPVTVCN